MQYVPIYAFEEIPAVFGDSPYDQSSLSAFVGRLTRVLAKDNSFSLQFLADDIRLQVFGWYQRASEVALDSAQLAEAVLDQFGHDLQLEAIQVLLRLVQITPSGFSPQVLARDELQRGLSDAAEALIKARVLKSVGTQSGQALQLADPAILQTWPAYMNWIREDLPFLQWRQSISTAARSWNLAGRESGLLRDDSLEEARKYLKLRADELNEDERQYISASVERDERQRTFEELSRVNEAAKKDELAKLQAELSALKSDLEEHAPGRNRFFTPTRVFLTMILGLLVTLVAMAAIDLWKRNELKRLAEGTTQQQQEQAKAAEQPQQLMQQTKRIESSPSSWRSAIEPPEVQALGSRALPRQAVRRRQSLFLRRVLRQPQRRQPQRRLPQRRLPQRRLPQRRLPSADYPSADNPSADYPSADYPSEHFRADDLPYLAHLFTGSLSRGTVDCLQ